MRYNPHLLAVKYQISVLPTKNPSCHLCVSACSLGAIGGDLGKLWVSEFLPVRRERRRGLSYPTHRNVARWPPDVFKTYVGVKMEI